MSQQESSEKKSKDASVMIRRNLGSGYSCCESCIQRSASENVFMCVCKLTTILVNVKDLPINRPILAGSDVLNGKQAKKILATTCVECGTEVEHKFFAVCKSEGCSKFQQLICLLCVHKKHKDHATSLFEEYIQEEGEECILKLELQHDRISLFHEFRTNAHEAQRRMEFIRKILSGNEGNRRVLEQTCTILEEKIEASLLDPFHSELQKTNDTLKSLLINLETTFGDGCRGAEELQLGEEENVIVMDLREKHTLRVIDCTEIRSEVDVYYKLRLALPSASHELRLLPGQLLGNEKNFMYSNLSIEERGHVHLLADKAQVIGSEIEVRGYTSNFVYEGRGVARTRQSNSSEWEKRSFKRIVMVTYKMTWIVLHCLSFIKGMTRNREDNTQLDIIFNTWNGKVVCKQEIDEAVKNADHVRVIYLKTPLKSLNMDVPQLEKPDEDTAIIVVNPNDAAVFNQSNPNNLFDITVFYTIR